METIEVSQDERDDEWRDGRRDESTHWRKVLKREEMAGRGDADGERCDLSWDLRGEFWKAMEGKSVKRRVSTRRRRDESEKEPKSSPSATIPPKSRVSKSEISSNTYTTGS